MTQFVFKTEHSTEQLPNIKDMLYTSLELRRNEKLLNSFLKIITKNIHLYKSPLHNAGIEYYNVLRMKRIEI